MKKIVSLFSFLLLLVVGTSAFGQAGNGNGNGNAWGNENNPNNGSVFNPGNHGSLPLLLVNKILDHSAEDLSVPKGILLNAYFRGECTIVFDFVLGAYLVSYGGGLSVVLVTDLS